MNIAADMEHKTMTKICHKDSKNLHLKKERKKDLSFFAAYFRIFVRG